MITPAIQLPKAILYYPTIEFQDEGWLRASLCIWERVERIVPPGYKPKDSHDVAELSDAGLVRGIELSAHDMKAASESFSALLTECACRPAALEGNDEALVRLHKGKVGERLYQMFESISLPLDTDDGWFGLPKSLCHGYMSHLAEIAARRRGIAKVTDNKDSFAVAPFFDTDGMLAEMGYDPEAKSAQAALGLTTIIPARVSHLTVAELLAFRERTRDGRAALAGAVERLASEIASIQDEKAASERLADAAEDFRRSRELIARQSMYSGGDLLNATLCVGISVGLTAYSTFAAGQSTFQPRLVVGSVVIALVASMATAYAMRKQQPVDPVRSYYVDIENELKSVFASRYPNRENDFWAVMEEFIND